ncbi:hypothetical protein [Mucilaginibacter sp.]|uniref:hypothetical protein n=1 Tax=Mucilaginibacter sp. TaxID=1882438 RepID=UPI0035BC8008
MKKIRIICLCMVFAAVANAQQKKFNKPLADSLEKLVVVDQVAAYIPTGEYKKHTPEQFEI